MASYLTICRAADVADANAELDAAGLGPENLSLPCTTDAQGALAGTAQPTHYCAHFASLAGAELDAVAAHFASPAAQSLGRQLRVVPAETPVDEALADAKLYRILPQV